ncbi:glutamyl-tRNA reductase [Archaeoglobus sulfaticallidus PM70-1]|uniref:Glutamyl-tRNA reductase n=1 Tax=Archaeoglobus sulfaticallidus PM70-1 TaxID=387631 RepID=N0BKA3_9EURY|nr:glutamyl-tRNA reductase [Archaeoglobus sulfaticallidus]AGK60580.1 glutamyl-tRNA reductase [Archaeoglobus sulfaticallidus PM70-1]
MEITCMVISHKKAPIDVLEKIWQKDLRKVIVDMLSRKEISECAFLMTCNRVELYLVGNNTMDVLREFSSKFEIDESYVEYKKDDSAIMHLMRVCSGLESMMVGEDQILGQVREYYHICKDLGGIGGYLDLVFKKAINTGRKVRNLTGINKGSVSIGSAAVELAEDVLGSLDGRKILLIGAGEMGTLVANSIANKNACTVLIANRTYEKAEELAKKIGGVAVRFDMLESCMTDCDVIISATSAPHYILRKDTVERVMRNRDRGILIVDIALPRDVEEDVKQIPGVELYTIDDLRIISERNLEKRKEKIPMAEKIIHEEFINLKNAIKEKKANHAISLMYSSAERIKRDEIIELYNKLSAKYGVDETVLPILEGFVNSLVKKYLRLPTMRLREAARNGKPEIIEYVEYLFGGEDFVSCNEDAKTEKEKAEADSERG